MADSGQKHGTRQMQNRSHGLRGNGRDPEGAETPAFRARRLRSPANACRRLERDPSPQGEGAAHTSIEERGNRSALSACPDCCNGGAVLAVVKARPFGWSPVATSLDAVCARRCASTEVGTKKRSL